MASIGFLNLPAEVRNKIYELALPLDGTLYTFSRAQGRIFPHATPALCRTSHHLRAETLPLFRGRNEFSIYISRSGKAKSGEPSLVRWLRQFRRSGAESLRMLRVWGTVIVPYPCGFGGVKCEAEVDLLVQGNEYYLGVMETWECPARGGKRDRSRVKGMVREMWVKVIERVLGRQLLEMAESMEDGGL